MVTIILPVFNGDRWLKDAIESVRLQSETDWELIVIDDGSMDSSQQIAKSAAATDSRIQIVQKEHSGLGSARNKGLEIAKGEFIMFLDSDDMLLPECLKNLLQARFLSKAGIIQGKTLKRKRPPKKEYIRHSTPSEGMICEIFEPEEAIENVLYQRKLDCSMWGKLFDAHLFKNIRFREGILYEDLDIFYRLFEKSKIIALTSIPVYFYRKNAEGLSHKWNAKRLDVLDVAIGIEKYMEKNHPELIKAARERRYSANFNMLILSIINGEKSRTAECRQFIRSHRFSSLMNQNARIKNRLASLLLWL